MQCTSKTFFINVNPNQCARAHSAHFRTQVGTAAASVCPALAAACSCSCLWAGSVSIHRSHVHGPPQLRVWDLARRKCMRQYRKGTKVSSYTCPAAPRSACGNRCVPMVSDRTRGSMPATARTSDGAEDGSFCSTESADLLGDPNAAACLKWMGWHAAWHEPPNRPKAIPLHQGFCQKDRRDKHTR